MEWIKPLELCWRIEEGEEIYDQLRLMQAERIYYLEEHDSWFIESEEVAYWQTDCMKLEFLIILN